MALPRSVDATDHEQRGAAHAGRIGRTGLVERRRRIAPAAADPDPVRPDLLQPHPSEVADHVRQQVRAGITDLVEHLFQHGMHRHQAAGAGRLGDRELAVLAHLDDRKAHVGIAVLHQLPVGEVAAGALRTAFDDVTRDASRREQVVLVFLPAELVHQRPQHHRGVHAAAGDHHVGPLGQRAGNRQGAEVSVHRYQHRRDRPAGWRSLDRARGTVDLHAVGELLAARQQVVTQHHRHAERQAGHLSHGLQRLLAGQRIDAARVGDDLDAPLAQLRQQRRHHVLDEISRIAVVDVPQPLGRQDRHRDLGQVVEDQGVDSPLFDERRGSRIGVPPEGGGTTDAQGFHASSSRWVISIVMTSGHESAKGSRMFAVSGYFKKNRDYYRAPPQPSR